MNESLRQFPHPDACANSRLDFKEKKARGAEAMLAKAFALLKEEAEYNDNRLRWLPSQRISRRGSGF